MFSHIHAHTHTNKIKYNITKNSSFCVFFVQNMLRHLVSLFTQFEFSSIWSIFLRFLQKSSTEIPSSALLSTLNPQQVIDVSNIQAATGSRFFQFVGNAAITGRSDLQAGIPAHFRPHFFLICTLECVKPANFIIEDLEINNVRKKKRSPQYI